MEDVLWTNPFDVVVPEGKRLLCELNATGDTKLIWDADNPEEVENARETFDRLKKKGFAAFSVGKKGEQDSKISKFDPNLEKIIMVPPIAGGQE